MERVETRYAGRRLIDGFHTERRQNLAEEDQTAKMEATLPVELGYDWDNVVVVASCHECWSCFLTLARLLGQWAYWMPQEAGRTVARKMAERMWTEMYEARHTIHVLMRTGKPA